MCITKALRQLYTSMLGYFNTV